MVLLSRTSITAHSALTFVYTFLNLEARKHTSCVFTFHVNTEPLGLHLNRSKPRTKSVLSAQTPDQKTRTTTRSSPRTGQSSLVRSGSFGCAALCVCVSVSERERERKTRAKLVRTHTRAHRYFS